MKDGRETEGDDRAQPADKVVRLPRDWLGPRTDLVPFGPQASAPTPEAPPSAADFWGERSAAIHDAVQLPAEEPIEVTAGASGSSVAPGRRRAFGRLTRQRVAAATAVAVAGVAVVSLAFGVLPPSGSPPHDAGAAKLNVAAVLSDGVSRTLQHGLELLGASAGRGPTPAAARRGASAIRRTPRSRAVFKPVHETTHSHPIASASSVPPSSPAVVRSSPSSTVHTYQPATVPSSRGTSETTSPTLRRSGSAGQGHATRPSAASVSPTGESGALGPIQSPNG